MGLLMRYRDAKRDAEKAEREAVAVCARAEIAVRAYERFNAMETPVTVAGQWAARVRAEVTELVPWERFDPALRARVEEAEADAALEIGVATEEREALGLAAVKAVEAAEKARAEVTKAVDLRERRRRAYRLRRFELAPPAPVKPASDALANLPRRERLARERSREAAKAVGVRRERDAAKLTVRLGRPVEARPRTIAEARRAVARARSDVQRTETRAYLGRLWARWAERDVAEARARHAAAVETEAGARARLADHDRARNAPAEAEAACLSRLFAAIRAGEIDEDDPRIAVPLPLRSVRRADSEGPRLTAILAEARSGAARADTQLRMAERRAETFAKSAEVSEAAHRSALRRLSDAEERLTALTRTATPRAEVRRRRMIGQKGCPTNLRMAIEALRA